MPSSTASTRSTTSPTCSPASLTTQRRALPNSCLARSNRALSRLRIGHEPFDLPRSFGERSRSQFGAHSIDIIAEGYVWPHEQNYGVLPSRSMFDALVAANNVNPGPVVLDIEKLPLKVSPKRVQLFYA